jgi:hypothetical protein
MGEGRRRSGWRGRGGPGGCGCASVIVVLTLGLLLSLFNSDIGLGLSVRVPLTDSNITLAGSVGKKDRASAVLPSYARGHLGSNQDFINQSSTLTIWVAEGTALILVGRQPGAPVVDLHLEAW